MNMNGLQLLVDISPILLHKICKDIQSCGKWVQFGAFTNLTAQDLAIIENTPSPHCHAYEIMYRWFSKSPNVNNLATVLKHLKLEQPLLKLKGYLSEETIEILLKKIDLDRAPRILNDENFQFNKNENSNADQLQMEPPSSSHYQTDEGHFNGNLIAKNSNTSEHVPSISKETGFSEYNKIETRDKIIFYFQSILERKSMSFSDKEFQIEELSMNLQLGSFSTTFPFQLRRTMFNIQSFSVPKLLESKKKQKKLYNIIWSLTNLKLYSLPILSGYYLSKEYLYLIYPYDAKSLFTILHHSSDTGEIISPYKRLKILKTIGEAVNFIHSFEPSPVFHGRINSENVLIGSHVVLLSGFEKIHTDDTGYRNGLEIIENEKITNKDFRSIDVNQYLLLIYETWWNVPHPKSISIKIDKNVPNYMLKYPGSYELVHDKMCKLIENQLGKPNPIKIETVLEQLSSIEWIKTTN